MALEQFLAQLAQKEMGGMDPLSQVPPVAPQMQQQTQMQQPQLRDPLAGSQPQASPQTGKFTGLRDTLGTIGDYLLQANEMAPIYAPRKAEHKQTQASEAIAAYLGNIDPALADIVRNDTKTGMEIYKGLREDKRFDRTAEQGDKRIDMGWAELGERSRSNQAREGLTANAQQQTVELQRMRMRDAQIDRQLRLALQANDHAAAERLQKMKLAGQKEIATLTADLQSNKDSTVTTTIKYPGKEAENNWFADDVEAKPERTVVTKRPANAKPKGPSQADLEFTAKKHGITVEEVKRRLGVN